jgi:hypothetical protein
MVKAAVSPVRERLCVHVADARILLLRLGIIALVLLQFLLMALLRVLRSMGPAQLSRLLTRTCQIASPVLLLALAVVMLLLVPRHLTIFVSIFLPIIGVGALIFLYDRWRAWYPDQAWGPIVRRYTVRLMRIGAVGLSYAGARYQVNELTGVDPGNFPIALTALTTLFTLPIWLVISIYIFELIAAWYLLCYWRAKIKTIRRHSRPPSNDWLQELDLAQIRRHRGPLKYLTDAWYRVRNSQSVRSFLGLKFDDQPDLFNQGFRAAGAMCLVISTIALSLFLLGGPWSRPFVRLIAANILVATEFSYDRTCIASSQNRWVAVLKYRREMQTSMVSLADLHERMKFARMWRDISFTIGTCD